MKRLILEKEAIKKNLAVIRKRAGSSVIYAVLTGDAYGAGLVEMAKLSVKRLILEKEAIKKNLAVIRKRAGSSVIYAVLTGDAYGAGLVEMAKLLRDEGIGRFAISEPDEAEKLRKAGFVDEELLMLRSTTNREELEKLMDLNVICTIGSYDAGVALNGIAEGRATVVEAHIQVDTGMGFGGFLKLMDLNVICTIGSYDAGVALNGIAEGRATVVEAHIQVDTGMGFGGFLSSEPDKILSMYRYLPNVAISGIYTQIHSAAGGKRGAQLQLDEFQMVLNAVTDAGFETGTVHAAGSTALMRYELEPLGAVRVGSAILGRNLGGGNHLTKVGYGEAALEEITWLPKGHTVGNDKIITLNRPTRVAVLPVGYQNGFGVGVSRGPGLWAVLLRWWKGRKAYVQIGAQRAPIIGKVGAIETLVDVTDLKCNSGDIARFEIDPLFARGFTKELR